MTNPFFCSEVSAQVGEDLIGSAAPCQTYVLVECPLPWKADAFESKAIPKNLRDLVTAVKQSRLSIRFLLINSGRPNHVDGDRTHVLIYHQSPAVFCSGYQRWEQTVDRLEAVAPLVQSVLLDQPLLGDLLGEPDNCGDRDLFICVHGSHDKCCAKYGLPFHRAAIATLAELRDPSLHSPPIRLWQTSHFGGHRFAPTLIDLPSGRYYGRLNQTVLQSILTRSGDLQTVAATYRGWGILPTWLQPAEKALMQQYGWAWFDHRIAYQMTSQSTHRSWIRANLSVAQANGAIHTYKVELVKDLQRTVCLRSSCGSSQESEQVKYRVESLYRSRATAVTHSVFSDQMVLS